MKPIPPVFRTLDASVYKKIAGELRGRLPGHVMIDVDRGKDENGKSIVMLRCKQPEVAKKVLAGILGEEYIEPEIEEDFPEKRREWWQRSIQMYFGDKRGDANEIRKSVEGYRKRFQSDALRVRRRMFPEGKGGVRAQVLLAAATGLMQKKRKEEASRVMLIMQKHFTKMLTGMQKHFTLMSKT